MSTHCKNVDPDWYFVLVRFCEKHDWILVGHSVSTTSSTSCLISVVTNQVSRSYNNMDLTLVLIKRNMHSSFISGKAKETLYRAFYWVTSIRRPKSKNWFLNDVCLSVLQSRGQILIKFAMWAITRKISF